jgi:hypothetical protein
VLLIIDADPLVYRSGFAAESISYDCVAEAEDGFVSLHFAPSAGKSANDKLKEWQEANPSSAIIDKQKVVTAEPVSHALEIARASLEAIESAVAKNFKLSLSVGLYLSGKANWRNKVATLLPYKGNRDPSHKPVHYQALRDYMETVHSAVVTDGIEADDAVATLARTYRDQSYNYCVASIDKDLDQIPGWHYDYMKKVFYFIDAEDAAKSFWGQVLSGDSTDNIGGVWKLGAKGAKAKVDEWYAKETSPQGIWDQVVLTYRASQAKPACPYADKDPCAVALENARLLYLQQKPDELWQPPPMPRGKVSVEFAG